MRIAGTALALLAALCVAGCAAGSSTGEFEPHTANTLTVVTEPLPTQGFWEGEGDKPTGGAEYELAQELAKRLGVDHVVVRTEDFSKIVAGELGDADVALALITPTDERREVLDFTTPYLEAAPTLLVKGDREVADVQTAQELRWVVGANTTFVDIVDTMIRPDAPPVQIEDRAEEVRMVADGEADVAMFDLPAAAAIVEQEPGLSMAAQLSDTEPIAAALPKDSPNTQAVGSAIRAMISDGTVDTITERSLGASISDVQGSVPLLRTDNP